MKKFLILFLVLLLTLGALSLSACSLFGKKGDSTPALSDDSIRAVYTAYAESGGTLSYEEWVDSIKGEKGDTGAAGVGIASIVKTSTVGLVDTYTITLTNGSTTTFTVTNGRDGSSGSTSTNPNAPTPDEYFRFTLLEDDTYEISARYLDMPPRVVIPSTYNGKSVTSIAARAFVAPENGRSSIDEVVIPSSVTSIGELAFSGCSGLTSITIPSNVTSIGSGAFSGCSGLTSVTIPNSVTSIGQYAFHSCSGLTSITIPSSVTTIGSGAFFDCTGLTSVTIPNSVTTIVYYTFYGCTGLTSITIPSSVTSIGVMAFSSCSGLTSITIPSSVTSIGESAFSGCSGLTSVAYQGTKAQWALIELNRYWAYDSNISIIHCSDGDIEL